MRRSVFLIFISAMLLIVVFALLTQSLFIVKRLAKVEGVAGKVMLKRGGMGDFAPLGKAEFVMTEDTLKTGEDGIAELRWLDGTRLKMAPRTEMTVKKSSTHMVRGNDETEFALTNGTIFVRIMKALSPQSRFEVQTPTAVAAVRGTIFMVKVEAGKTQVAVHKGSVKVSSGEGSDLHESLIEPGTVASSSSPGDVNSAKDAAIEAIFAAQSDIIKPELSAKIMKLQNGEKLLLQGRTEAGNTVTVNGQKVTLLDNGMFTKRTKSQPGKNEFKIVTTDPHGETAELTKTIALP